MVRVKIDQMAAPFHLVDRENAVVVGDKALVLVFLDEVVAVSQTFDGLIHVAVAADWGVNNVLRVGAGLIEALDVFGFKLAEGKTRETNGPRNGLNVQVIYKFFVVHFREIWASGFYWEKFTGEGSLLSWEI